MTSIATPTIPPTPRATLRALREEFQGFLRAARTPRVRSMAQWAEDEIILPKGGPYGDRKWRRRFQPFGGLLLDAFDDPRFNRFAVFGCVQSGKTFHATVIPTLYHLFELGHDVVYGVPTMDIAFDKWRRDLLKVILRTRYKHLLPTRGKGSRGGQFEAVQFGNGTELRFMSGRGGDEERSGFTARAVVVTEVDKFDVAKDASKETGPIGQLEARADAFDDQARIYLECTVSTSKGTIFREHQQGAAGQIVCPCPHCNEWVRPERDHLLGHQEARDELEAKERSHFYCPNCGQQYSEEQRGEMNQHARLVYGKQTIDADGQVAGDPPRTRTCGIRWSAFNNLFWSQGNIGVREWKAANDPDAADPDAAEKRLLQFVWGVPWDPPEWDVVELDRKTVSRRFAPTWDKGYVPPELDLLTMGVDLGKRVLHWLAPAWTTTGRGHIVDYGKLDVASDHLGEERAVLTALRELRDLVLAGFRTNAGAVLPRHVLIDTRYNPGDVVYIFIRECQALAAERPELDRLFLPSMGMGIGKQYLGRYSEPKDVKGEIVLKGPHYHIKWRADHGVFLVMNDADYWKTFLHERLATPITNNDGQQNAGAMTLFYSRDPNEHVSLAAHFTSEKQVVEFVPEVGEVRYWKRLSRSNHWLDCGYNACVAGHLAGVRLVAEPKQPTTTTPARHSRLTTPDGRPYLITERD